MSHATLADYSFRPFAERDLTLLARWLARPEVARWWPHPDEQLSDLRQELARHRLNMQIVALDDRDFAYVQYGNARDWEAEFVSALPPRTASVDLLIGESDLLGRGHGPALLRRLCKRLIKDGWANILIDPAADNLRAQRAFVKAGFVGDEIVATPDGPARLMFYREQPDG